MVVSIGIFCSTANAIAEIFLTSYAINFEIATVVAKLNIFENEPFTALYVAISKECSNLEIISVSSSDSGIKSLYLVLESSSKASAIFQ